MRLLPRRDPQCASNELGEMFVMYFKLRVTGAGISFPSRIILVSRRPSRAGRISSRWRQVPRHGWGAAACFLGFVIFSAVAVGQGDTGGGHGNSAPDSQNQAAAAWRLAQSDPGELVRRASQNELANSTGDNEFFRFRVRKTDRKSDTTKEVVRTRDGGVARLVAVDGHPLSPRAERSELSRLRELEADPDKERHRREGERKDAKRVAMFTRLLPQAFLYEYVGRAQASEGTMIRLKFTPNPKFSPPDLGSRVMTGIRGEVWIDPKQVRIVHIRGRVYRKVDFGWGILGVLYPGGTMRVDQSNTPECGWQLTRLSLHLTGKELLFKSIDISLEESAGDYHRVPKDWSYRDAIRWLLQWPAQAPVARLP